MVIYRKTLYLMVILHNFTMGFRFSDFPRENQSSDPVMRSSWPLDVAPWNAPWDLRGP